MKQITEKDFSEIGKPLYEADRYYKGKRDKLIPFNDGLHIIYKRREGQEEFKDFNLADYARMSFGMFGGEKIKVKLEFDNVMVGVMINRFGKDIR